MNREKETLLNKVLSEPDIPYLVSKKSINRLIERMQPETQDMKEYLIAYYSAETNAESQAILKEKYASMTPAQAKAFDAAYLRCLENDVNYGEKVQSL